MSSAPRRPGLGWTLGQTLNELSLKARLPPDAWKQDARLFVFTAQVFAE